MPSVRTARRAGSVKASRSTWRGKVRSSLATRRKRNCRRIKSRSVWNDRVRCKRCGCFTRWLLAKSVAWCKWKERQVSGRESQRNECHYRREFLLSALVVLNVACSRHSERAQTPSIKPTPIVYSTTGYLPTPTPTPLLEQIIGRDWKLRIKNFRFISH